MAKRDAEANDILLGTLMKAWISSSPVPNYTIFTSSVLIQLD